MGETYDTLKERNDVFKRQFQNAYGVDYCNEANYDLVINVEDFDSPEAIVKSITQKLNEVRMII